MSEKKEKAFSTSGYAEARRCEKGGMKREMMERMR